MAVEFFREHHLNRAERRSRPRPTSGVATMRYSSPRTIVASAEKLKLTGKMAERVDKRVVSAWQTTAWQLFDAIGEIHFAFSLMGQLLSRVRLFPAIVEYQDEAPVHVEDFLEKMREESQSELAKTTEIIEKAKDLLDDLALNAHGGISNLMRLMGVNFQVAGEMYLLNHDDKWHVASVNELDQHGRAMYYKQTRDRPTNNKIMGEKLAADAFIARIWRPHPRYTAEPDSSMLGALEECELLLLLQQMIRQIIRSKMNAGAMFIPEGIASMTSGSETDTVETSLARAAMESVEDESAQSTIVPLFLKGPPELGEKIKWIPFGRQLDKEFVELVDRTLQRVLQGLDIPKDIVSGLADAKFSNAVVITDELFKAHIEPIVLLIVDSLTNVYFRPLLKKAFPELTMKGSSNILNRLVIWADTSDVSSRPDKSQAANEGYGLGTLSGKAWRETRGFASTDAPTPEETLQRAALERGSLAPEMVDALVQSIDPEFFDTLKKQTAADAEIPPEIDELLKNSGAVPADEGEAAPAAPAVETEQPTSLDDQLSGGEVNPNGALPPQPAMT